MVGSIGWIDWVTGWEWSLFVFYANLIGFVMWEIGGRAGMVFVCLCTVVWWAANLPRASRWERTGHRVGGAGPQCVRLERPAAMTRHTTGRARKRGSRKEHFGKSAQRRFGLGVTHVVGYEFTS